MSTYAQLQAHYATQAAADVRGEWARQQAFIVPRAATIIVAASSLAVALADATLARRLGRLPVGLTVDDQQYDIVTSATASLLADQEARNLGDAFESNTADRLARMAEGMVGTAGRYGFGEAMRAHQVDGWTRTLVSDDPCPLCTDLADGTVLSADQDMIDHPGCSCIATPVMAGVGADG